jgi:hypothetical protein
MGKGKVVMRILVSACRLPFSGMVLCLIMTAALCAGQNVYAAEKEIPLTFDAQLIRIFEAAQTAPDVTPFYAPNESQRKALRHILDLFRSHKMALKNVVYRPDMKGIRITWADDDNNYIAKIAYKTDRDPVLNNSIYADKRQVVDVKIMYRTSSGDYDYLNLLNKDNFTVPGESSPAVPPEPKFNYVVNGKLTNEQCRFCHIIAKNDGEKRGIFFPRYQEYKKEQVDINASHLFRLDGFTPMPAGSAAGLALPAMQEEFLYRKIEDKTPDRDLFAHALMEMPQLIEVLARDNHKSTCVAIDYGKGAETIGMGRNDYVCADNAAQKLYVSFTNAVLNVDKDAVKYSEPYFEKQPYFDKK